MRRLFSALVIGGLSAAALAAGQAQRPEITTEITKWPDGKQAALALTYDDSTINQFRIALPMMNERGLPGTFFVITGEIPGSRFPPMFVGRPIMDILRESATVPTSTANVFERSSVLWYLGEIQRVEGVPGNINVQRAMQTGNFAAIDAPLAKLRESGVTYAAGARPWVPVRSQESGRPPAAGPNGLSWEEFRREAAKGHEFANHAVSHPHLPALDEANILYEVDRAREDIREQLGEKHTFSIEAPYGIDDDRVRTLLINRFPLTRNWIADTDDFMDGIMRGNNRDPAASTREYVQWQRGPVSATPLEQMTGWVDSSLAHGVWLVLVIHGVEGTGYQPLPADRLRAFFDYVKAQEPRLWIATFQDGGKYVRERMKSTVTTKMAGATIEVSVASSLDLRVYDIPLTARTTVPPAWTTVDVRQGPSSSTLTVRREAGRSFVQYRVLLSAGTVTLRGRR